MYGKNITSPVDEMPLGHTLKKNEAVAAEVQHASDDLAVVSTVLEQELPDHIQVGDVAQAIEHTAQLEEKLARSAETLTQVNAALAREVAKRIEVTEQRDESQAMVDKLVGRSEEGASRAR